MSITDKICQYLQRTQDPEDPAKLFELEQYETWHITGACCWEIPRGRCDLGNVKGRFIDAIEYAVKQDDFYAEGDEANLSGYIYKLFMDGANFIRELEPTGYDKNQQIIKNYKQTKKILDKMANPRQKLK